MDSLTKENFWNELKEKYPFEMEAFCKWIDEYKKRVDWLKLFNGINHENDFEIDTPKYHDLPIAMQVGIFIQFTIENNGAYFLPIEIESPPMEMDWYVALIRAWFDDEHEFNK